MRLRFDKRMSTSEFEFTQHHNLIKFPLLKMIIVFTWMVCLFFIIAFSILHITSISISQSVFRRYLSLSIQSTIRPIAYRYMNDSQCSQQTLIPFNTFVDLLHISISNQPAICSCDCWRDISNNNAKSNSWRWRQYPLFNDLHHCVSVTVIASLINQPEYEISSLSKSGLVSLQFASIIII